MRKGVGIPLVTSSWRFLARLQIALGCVVLAACGGGGGGGGTQPPPPVTIAPTQVSLNTVFTTTPGVCGASIDQPQCGGSVASLSIAGSRMYVGSQDVSSSYRGNTAYFFFPVDLATGAPLDP
jgi:hypothetical protein